jgi:RNA polymerase sigma-70 factor (ECF subfamily)
MAIEHMRKMRASDPPLAISIYDKITDEKELADLLPSAALTASDELIKDEISKKLNDAIEALPVKERLITKLNMLYDKPYHEIADILNLPKGTVSSYIKRAREKLKKSLRDWPRP